MYQCAIDRQLWADIYGECANVTQKVPAVMWLVTTARHPDLGTVVAVEDEHLGIVLLSENALQAREVSYLSARAT